MVHQVPKCDQEGKTGFGDVDTDISKRTRMFKLTSSARHS
jgi:hypothetical protein